MRYAVLLVLVFGCAACSESSRTSSGTGPSPTPTLNLAGTWSGDIIVSGQTGRMTWTLTQSGSSVTGPVLVGLPNGVVLLNGTLSGTLTGSTMAYAINVGAGGIPTEPACTGRLDGTVTVAPSTLAGSYTVGTSSCKTGFTGGNFTLTR